MTAFQALGPFISTFADASITGLLQNDNGEIVITDREMLAERLDDLEKVREDIRVQTEADEAFKKAEAEAEAEAAATSEAEESKKSEESSGDSELAAEKKESEGEEETNEEEGEEKASNDAAVIDQAEDMDLTEDKEEATGEKDDEHLEAAAEAEVKAIPTKMVHSRSEGDLSLEEERALAYQKEQKDNTENNNNNSSASSTSGGGLTSSESYNNFLFWREPVPVLEELEDIKSSDETSSSEGSQAKGESCVCLLL